MDEPVKEYGSIDVVYYIVGQAMLLSLCQRTLRIF